MRCTLALTVLLLLSSACAPLPGAVEGSCTLRLQHFEAALEAAALAPRYPRYVPEFPALATDRTHAALVGSHPTAGEWRDWLSRLAELGRQRRAIAWSALAPAVADRLRDGGVGTREALETCALTELAPLQSGHADDSLRQRLAGAVRVPDNYSTAKRALGLYPLTGWFAGAGIARLQEETRASYAEPLHALPVTGELRRYVPAPALPADTDLPLPTDTLGLRMPAPVVLDALFARHAPVLELDQRGPADHPGAPYFDSAGLPRVDPGTVRGYRYATLTRFAGELRLQLNYLWWFDERPAAGPLDSLAGRLDGLLWRTTLDNNGSVLLYDAIHPCGCYHLLFPSPRLQPREGVGDWPEPPLVPQPAPELQPGERVVLRISSGEHFIQRVFTQRETADSAAAGAGSEPGIRGPAAGNARTYELRSYGELYRLAGPAAPTSLFSAGGLVPGTQRGERFYLWPMGIRSPGAMRERGLHAIAFRGRRHFDDADLLDRIFALQR